MKKSFRLHSPEGDLRCSLAVTLNTNSVCKFSWCIPLYSSVYICIGSVADKAYSDGGSGLSEFLKTLLVIFQVFL